MKYTRNSIQHDEESPRGNPHQQIPGRGRCLVPGARRTGLSRTAKSRIDGHLAVMGEKVLPGQKIEVEDRPVVLEDELVYLVYHKPAGVVCTTDRSVYRNIIDAVGHPKRVFPVGRPGQDVHRTDFSHK